MKKIIPFFIMICCLLAVSSCSYDNFEEPKATLTGKAIYDGEAVGLEAEVRICFVSGWLCSERFYSGVYCPRWKLFRIAFQW